MLLKVSAAALAAASALIASGMGAEEEISAPVGAPEIFEMESLSFPERAAAFQAGFTEFQARLQVMHQDIRLWQEAQRDKLKSSYGELVELWKAAAAAAERRFKHSKELQLMDQEATKELWESFFHWLKNLMTLAPRPTKPQHNDVNAEAQTNPELSPDLMQEAQALLEALQSFLQGQHGQQQPQQQEEEEPIDPDFSFPREPEVEEKPPQADQQQPEGETEQQQPETDVQEQQQQPEAEQQQQPEAEEELQQQPETEQQQQQQQPEAEQQQEQQQQPEADQPEQQQPEVEEQQQQQPEVEQQQPEAEQPEQQQPEAEQPEQQQPEAEQPEQQQPETEVQQQQQPEQQQPEVEQPEQQQPETEVQQQQQEQVEPEVQHHEQQEQAETEGEKPLEPVDEETSRLSAEVSDSIQRAEDTADKILTAAKEAVAAAAGASAAHGAFRGSQKAEEVMRELETLNAEFAKGNAAAAAELAAVDLAAGVQSNKWIEEERKKVLKKWLVMINVHQVNLIYLSNKAAAQGVSMPTTPAARHEDPFGFLSSASTYPMPFPYPPAY